jgi:UDP-glucose:(heptosyl)LPS alpha-1,3-glucosyltransferase
MKIAINHTRFAATGGVERYIYNLMTRLLSDGNEIHYYCYKWEPYSHPCLFFHRVPYIKGIRSLKILSFAFFSHLLLRRRSFDLILGFGKTYYQDIYRDGAGCLQDYQKYSLAVIQNSLRRWLRKISLYQQSIKFIETLRFRQGNFKRIIPISEFVKAQILHRHRVRPDQVEVVYSGADCERFTPANQRKHREEVRKQFGIAREAFVILFVGNDFRRKGLDTIFKAIPHLRKFCPRLKVLVVGTDRHEEEFFGLAETLGVGEEVVFAGHQPDVPRFYAAGDIFVLPSRFDPFCNAVLEAMAAGLPVIVSTTTGACEVTEGAGLVVHDTDSETELAEKVKPLLDEKLRMQMGINARKKAEALNWDEHMKRMVQIYKEVAEQKK